MRVKAMLKNTFNEGILSLWKIKNCWIIFRSLTFKVEWPCVWVIYTWLQEKASTEETTKQHSFEVQHGNHYNTAPSLLEHSDNWLKFQCGWAWLKAWIKRQIVIHIYGYAQMEYTHIHTCIYFVCYLTSFVSLM